MLKNYCTLFLIKIKYLILKHTRLQKYRNKYEKFKKLDKDKIISSININGFCIIDNYFNLFRKIMIDALVRLVFNWCPFKVFYNPNIIFR